MDLEPKIRDLTHMAELARFHAIDTFGLNCPDETEEGKREREIALFAVVHSSKWFATRRMPARPAGPSARSPA
jgi:hypothetical protein